MSKLYQTLPLRVRVTIILGMVLVFLGSSVLVAMADSAGPALTGFTPETSINVPQGSTFNVSLTASDPDKIKGSSVVLKLNGTLLSKTVTYGQNGTDYTTAFIQSAAISYTSLMSQNTVTVSVSDQLGTVSTAQWTFTGAVSPSITNLKPANGANSNTFIPTVSANVTDSSGIDANSIILKIDTVTVNHTYANGLVSFTPAAPLVAGRHDIYLEVKDSAGNMNSASWYFNINQGNAAFSAAQPAPAATVDVASTQIKVDVASGVNLDKNSAVMLVDGKKVASVFSYLIIGGHWATYYDPEMGETTEWVVDYDYTKGAISYNVTGLADGPHTVAVSIADTTGSPNAYTWTFTAKVPPKVSDPAPINTTVATQYPLISAKVTDNVAVSNVKMLVDGVERAASFNPLTNEVSYLPSAPLLNDVSHSVQVIATDAVGASGSLSWNFNVQILPDMPFACSDCHMGYPAPNHLVSNCNACHGTDRPIGDCMYCHGYGGMSNEKLIGRDCQTCHSPNYPTIPNHPDLTVLHNTTTSVDGCRPCHVLSLTREHYNQTDAGGSNYTCQTCHSSTNPLVQQAIAGKQKNCEACHPQANHDAVHTIPDLNSQCAICHKNILNQEHMNNPKTQSQTLDCNTCHGSTDTRVQQAITDKQKNCDACHAPTDHQALHNTTIEAQCANCHKNSLTQEHMNNPATQTKTLDCSTCHASTDTRVQQAITGKLKNCDACHDNADHDALHNTTALDSRCTTCHKNNITQEHLSNPVTQTNPATGQPKPWNCQTCHGSNVDALVAGALSAAKKHCTACHRQGHNLNFAENMPADIPLYTGFKWTLPDDARLWESESWMPAEFLSGGNIVISNRRLDVTGDGVWAFYQSQMAANCWTLASGAPAAGSNYYSVTFTKDARKAIIWFYGGSNHDASPVSSMGYRIEILYK